MRVSRPERIALYLFCIWAFATGQAYANRADSTDERTEILDVIGHLFDAVATRRPEDWRAVLLEDGLALSVRRGPDGKPLVTMIPNRDMLATMAPVEARYFERWTEDPTVLIEGAIAVVWGRYDFWIDGHFSHCGVDSIDLIKQDGAWKVVNIMWTVEQTHCPTAKEPVPEKAFAP